MGKLSKREVANQAKLMELLDGDLSEDDKDKFFQEFNEAFIGDVTHQSAYFTPLELAYDFVLMSPKHGYVLDACAGIGVIAHAAFIRDAGNIDHVICIESNPKFVEIGKKLVPQAEWYCGSIFDQKLHQDIFTKHGIERYDCLLSNPPFGTTTMKYVPDGQRDWLSYTGKEFDMAVIEVGHRLAEYASYILPSQSCTFDASGSSYPQHRSNRKFEKLKKDIGQPQMIQQWTSIDTSVYAQFKNTKVMVECCSVEVDE